MRRTEKARALEECGGVIRYLAAETWKRLSGSAKAFTEVEDLVQEGKMFVWESALPNWDRKRGQKMTTWVYGCLRQHYINETLKEYTQKRKKKDLPIPEPTQIMPVWEAMERYQTLYKLSSPEMKSLLAGVVGRPRIEREEETSRPQRHRMKGRRWNRLRAEFAELIEALNILDSPVAIEDLLLLQKYGQQYLIQ